MTILIGAVHNNEIIIGADSLWSWDTSFVRESKTSKFLDVGTDRVLIASAGQDKFSQILIKLIKANRNLLEIKSPQEILNLAETLHREVVDCGIGDPGENELPSHDMEFMLGVQGLPSIWVISSDYAVHEYDDYVCAGAGFILGEGAMKALSLRGIRGLDAVETALETVCSLHPLCGGRLEIKKIENV